MENIDVIINEPRYLERLYEIINDFNRDIGVKDKNVVKTETLAKIRRLKSDGYKNAERGKKRELEEFARYWENENDEPVKKRKSNDLSDFAEYWGNDVDDVSNQTDNVDVNDINVDFGNVLNYKASEGGKKTKRKRGRKVKTIKKRRGSLS